MEVSTLLQNRKLRMVVPITQTAFIKAHLGHPQWDQCPGDPFSLEVTEILQSYFILSLLGFGQDRWGGKGALEAEISELICPVWGLNRTGRMEIGALEAEI